MNVIVSEWTKIRTVRATRWAPLAAFAAVPALAVLVGLTRSLQPDDTILGGSLTGAVVGQVGVATFGVLVMSSEYSTGMVRLTFIATPRRGMVLTAKAAIVAASSFGGGVVSCTAAYLIGRALLADHGYRPGEPMPALVGMGLSFSAAGLLGLAAVVIVRHTAGALALAVGIVLLPAMIGPVLGTWGRPVVAVAPATALQKLAQSSDMTTAVAGELGAWPTLLVVCAYTVVSLGAAAWLLVHRDA